jgi:hypothetical protein
MALVKNETKEYKCDFCGEICTPVTAYRYTHSMTEEGNKKEIVFNVGGRIPFVTDTPDVCHTCAKMAAEHILTMYS